VTDPSRPDAIPRFWRFWLPPDEVARRHADQHARRATLRGWWLHLSFALWWCLFMAAPISVLELVGIPLWIIFLLRLPRTWWITGAHTLRQPVFTFLLPLLAWQMLSLTWAPRGGLGWAEIEPWRWIWVPFILAAVLDARRWLVGALCIGFLLANLVQIVEFAGKQTGADWLVIRPEPDRSSIWWHPVVAGSLLTAMLGMHLPAALTGQGRWRWIGLGGAALSAVGVMLTGTRGAWIASLALVLLALGWAAWQIRPRTRLVRPALALAGLAAVVSVALWLAAGDEIGRRVQAGYDEVAAALHEDNYDSHTGARILMGKMALEAVATHPIRGVGAGGFRAWSQARLQARGMPERAKLIHPHAHSAPLHLAATAGLVGLGLALGAVVFALRGAFAPSAIPGAEQRASNPYDLGPAWALLGLLLAGAFDVVHINAQTAAMLFLLLAITPRTWRAVQRT